MYRVKLINYFDVWGNKKDGWEVNNQCIEWDDGIMVEISNREILELLKITGFLKKQVRINQIIFDDYGEFIELSQKKDYCPICRLEIEEWKNEKSHTNKR